MRILYLALLTTTLGCLGLIDYRLKLVLFADRKRALRSLVYAVIFFSLWDIAGILLGIFYIGPSQALTGLGIGQFPLEELFFLMVLCYNALLLFCALQKYRKQLP